MNETKKTIHFVGIGGIGMSGLALLCAEKGFSVQGSDVKISGKIIAFLQKKNIIIFEGHNQTLIPSDAHAVVISSAIKKNNRELEQARALGLPIYHRSEFLKKMLSTYKILAISGTHGKTTTTSLLGFILDYAKFDPLIMSGGIMKTYRSMMRFADNQWAVVEADESDKSLLNFEAICGSIVTNIEAEHMENYASFEALLDTYRKFLEKASDFCIVCSDNPHLQAMMTSFKNPIHFISYGTLGEPNLKAQNIQFKQTHTCFDVHFSSENETWANLQLNLLGKHNVLNALAAIGVARQLCIPENVIREALKIFCGIDRRLTITGFENKFTFIDDYAHHPTEIKAVLNALRQIDPDKKIIAIFQPHRYTRLLHHFDDFASSFLDADHTILLPVYSAGEKIIEGINSKILEKKISEFGKSVMFFQRSILAHNDLCYLISDLSPQGAIVLCMGAGDITELSYQLPQSMHELYDKIQAHA